MKLKIRVVLLVVALTGAAAGILFSVTLRAGSQKADGVEIKNEPHHRLKFENEFVRVWETVLPAGEVTLWHRHNFDNLAVTITDAKLRVEPLEGSPAESETKTGDVAFRRATYVHRASSVGTTTYHNFLIEFLKSPEAAKTTPPKTGVARQPVFENERVIVYRISLAPGESLPMHTHAKPGLSLVIAGSEIAVTTAGSDKIQTLTIAAGEARWRPGALTHAIRNSGKTRFEGVDVELK